jgi:hypothetical protein
MADHRIVCTDQLPTNQPTTHAHIVAVGVDLDNDGYADVKHTKQQVVNNINSGHRYYVYGLLSQKISFVEIVGCSSCGHPTIRSTPDAVRDNNLDYIRRCHWTS